MALLSHRFCSQQIPLSGPRHRDSHSGKPILFSIGSISASPLTPQQAEGGHDPRADLLLSRWC